MIKNNQIIETKITHAGIKKFFREHHICDVISEYIWNGFDAKSNKVEIDISRNKIDQIEEIKITDYGDGIDISNLNKNFSRFNESDKNSKIEFRGKNGRGRLSFFKVCQQALWKTKRNEMNFSILISNQDLTKFTLTELNNDFSNYSTQLELINFIENIDNDSLINYLQSEFCWYLAIYKDKNIIINGEILSIPDNRRHEKNHALQDEFFEINYLHWKNKPNSEKSINYYLDSENNLINKETNKFNNKGLNFYLSTIIKSNSYNQSEIELENPKRSISIEKAHRELKKQIFQDQLDIFNGFIKSRATEFIEDIEESGLVKFKTGDFAKIKNKQFKELIKEIYISDPQILLIKNQKQKTVLLNLIYKLIYSDKSDELLNIFSGILDLSEDESRKFSNLIESASLKSIIETIGILDRRKEVIEHIKELIFFRRYEVLETPDLQSIIENNTWLFGPQYFTIGAEEDDFNKIAKTLRANIKNINQIDIDDLDDIAEYQDAEKEIKIKGSQKQVDLFLTQSHKRFDGINNQYKNFVVIEIKRPSVSLNKKHFQQVMEYAELIQKNPSIFGNKRRFEIILVGTKISKDDMIINGHLENNKDKFEAGLAFDNKKGIKIFVKTWLDIIDEFELQNDFLLETYKKKLTNFENEKTTDLIYEASKNQ